MTAPFNSFVSLLRLLAFSLFVAITLGTPPLEAKTIHVKAGNASAAAPYTSWATAAATLQDALVAAVSGDQVWVTVGNYYPDEGANQIDDDRTASFELKSGVAIYGGFRGDEMELYQRSNVFAANNPSILSGEINQDNAYPNNSYNVVRAVGTDSSAILQGFMIMQGFADDDPSERGAGAGLWCSQGATPTISECIFRENLAVFGGAIATDGSSPTITNCLFVGNGANFGGAIFSLQSLSTRITNCGFSSNSANGGGGAVYNFLSTPTFTNCTFQGNQAVFDGGAIANESSTPSFTNCMIWKNQANGGTFSESASVFNDDSAPTYSHCLVDNFDRFDLNASGASPDNNLDPVDPRFLREADPADTTVWGDLRLSINSAVLDLGDNSANAETTDVMGNPRIQGGRIDLGAYEGTYDPAIPRIILKGQASINLTFNAPWTDPGASTRDDVDLPFPVVQIGGDTVNSSQPGSYTITYDAIDSDGNHAIQLTRTVIVANPITAPTIVLAGSASMPLAFGSTWTDPGATATDATGANVPVTIAGDAVDSSTPGVSYTITYNATDIYGNKATQRTRTVTISNPTAPPVIVLTDNPVLSIPFGSSWTEPGASATDATGANVAVIIAGGTVDSSKPGASYTLTYDATDIYGNTAIQVTRTVTIGNPTTPPLIVLTGNPTLSIPFGSTWADPGASATDATGANVAVIIAGGTVDSSTPGASYTLTYDATDIYGNTAIQVTRTVTIENRLDVVYVNAANGAGTPPYDSWATAAGSLQDALAVAVAGDQIWVAQGNYYPDEGSAQSDNDRTETFRLKNGIAIYGGFDGNETQLSAANPRRNFTTLSGDIDDVGFKRSYHVITATNVDVTAIVNGFIIIAGVSDGAFPNDRGAAIYNTSSSPAFVDCIINGSRATFGGAIFNQSSSPSFTRCYIGGNIAAENGGAVHNSANSSPSFSNCELQGNYAGQFGGAIHNEIGSAPTFLNCTFQGNLAVVAGGAFNNSASSPILTNCIVWNNQAAGVITSASASISSDASSIPFYSHSLVQNYSKATLDASGSSPNTNIGSQDPLFRKNGNPDFAPTTAATGNILLSPGSPAIDSGDNTANSAATDLPGSTRVQNGTIDLGAYEFNPLNPPPVIVLVGDFDMTISVGSVWTDPGATATNASGENLPVTIGGDTVDSAIIGASYTISYNATWNGNVARQLTRTVTIVDPTTPPRLKDKLVILRGATGRPETISWTTTSILQTSVDNRVWTDIPGAISPFTIPSTSEPKRFWRLRTP